MNRTVSRIAAAVFITILYGLSAVTTVASAAPAEEAGPARILVLGTSLTAGFQLPRDKSFTARLEAALREKGYDATVVNAGVSGDTSAGGLARLNWLLSEDYTHAIVELGGNDVLRGLEPEDTRANLDAILTTLTEHGIEVLLAGMRAPPNLGPDYEEEFNGLYAELAEKHGVLLYPFFLDGVAADPGLNLEDGIHPNAKGVAVIVERILPYVEKLLGDG
ncbi:MAG: arylesterase [bacterium]